MADELVFSVHPSVVYKLGEDLVTDEVQAIVELVKNSYDADASYASVRVQPSDDDDDAESFIEISDDGTGMTLSDIRLGWLTISDSPKIALKESGGTTPKGRTPLGDKGLGRLAVQRLGDAVTISTVPSDGSAASRVAFDWRDFDRHDSIADVPVDVRRIAKTDRTHGTLIRVSALRDGGAWASDKGRLANELSKLISPYSGVDKFRLVTVVDGERLDLADVGERMRQAALVHYDFSFDGKRLRIDGRMRLALLRPPAKAERAEFVREVEADRGRALREYVLGKPQANDLNIRKGSGGWFLEFSREERIDEMPGLVRAHNEIATPGPFEGEVDGYNLSPSAIAEQEVFGSSSEFKGLIQALAGIRVYRDGFGVRAGDDWLQLGKTWSSGSSYYGLKPQSTLGYVAISARDNSQLVETTDREGFKETGAFINLRRLMSRFIKYSADVQEFVGRGTVEFRKARDGEPDSDALSEAVETLESALGRGKDYARQAHSVRVSLARAGAEAAEVSESLDDDDPSTNEVIEILTALSRNATAAGVLLEQLQVYAEELSGFTKVGRELQSRVSTIEAQLDVAYETIGLGLTAEALAHEIKNIADRLARRTSQIATYAKKNRVSDVRIDSFIEHVRSTVAALRRQMAHLDPSLRYVRERRDRIVLAEVMSEIADFHGARWRRRREALNIDLDLDGDFAIFMNRGKFQQVIDNLIFNSEYWLEEDIKSNRIKRGTITVESDSPYIRIYDNGLGVSPTVESSLFEPFATAKPAGVGRGLGLFIVRRLLESEGCDIVLLPERNAAKRPFIFQLDLSGAVVE